MIAATIVAASSFEPAMGRGGSWRGGPMNGATVLFSVTRPYKANAKKMSVAIRTITPTTMRTKKILAIPPKHRNGRFVSIGPFTSAVTARP
jgi:hypothetical protein